MLILSVKIDDDAPEVDGLGATVFVFLSGSASATINFVRSSCIVRIYLFPVCEVGSGPTKSTKTRSKREARVSVIFLVFVCFFVWQIGHDLTKFSICFLM